MAQEIEKKFLIDLNKCGQLDNGTDIKQAYISTVDNTVVRVRVAGNNAYLTLKGENSGITRSEFEYEIPLSDAENIITELCSGPCVEKVRYLVDHNNHTWEIDIFHGDNKGLVIAEIELTSENEAFDKPEWVLEEVSGDPRYYNSSLLQHPFKDW